MSSKRLLVMAGGTGGHVFPGLAVAKYLEQQGWQIRWLGTADRMEADLVPKHGIDIEFIRVKGLIGSGLIRKLRAPWMILSAIWQARQIIKRYQPDAVLGMGGYVSGPGGIAAWLSGVPVVLHEQNAVAGLTNQWLAKVAKQVLQAFPGAFEGKPVVGNPVRRDVCTLPSPTARFRDRNGPLRILVMGGSQGARILNQTVPVAVAKTAQPVMVRHQAGKGNAQSTEAAYHAEGVTDATVTEFIDDVASAYAWADVVICRSGALTVSELAAAGVGAIFVPFMHADRQQALNGDYLVERDAALMIEQPSLTAATLAETIDGLDRARLLTMANAARDAAIIDADARVAQVIAEQAK
ncbi:MULTISPECIES: undecaprenyldiphospho-muramoylpentapeptide beta-N-acetylglucosaminyltransferase [Salinivibrio]|uniref:undecaprenyldiphospho-muramoylpentapeptide beta-N-acetylglucosaminyltransferase n=1 Tax=Salinivibrio TaxID=51366 RepID=UPI00084BEE8E|nr:MULTISPECIES: undecaprenyldiphospho-muramoylpentapeptide beta-N-acetylglucosaminyltransferase [Salinivibrio]ODQ01633.1 undecaprenyldiphospho-muramoylpentapeptide beta-N-acetylglucosaminyltransferase [Salinivibrio sp. DV]OOF18542.1 undecaprenyldiphospho-muramoylpentapeptide beta-N-acetylglucosaminyltransferase [Salinivibrio sp. PR932]OOF31519.1 undecaprenyldiphospho-muramoylpentapeptide beta-N-acetylglucosaminyltransferase [Salinivibrio proteolyticus]